MLILKIFVVDGKIFTIYSYESVLILKKQVELKIKVTTFFKF